jgi:hypothetical protein
VYIFNFWACKSNVFLLKLKAYVSCVRLRVCWEITSPNQTPLLWPSAAWSATRHIKGPWRVSRPMQQIWNDNWQPVMEGYIKCSNNFWQRSTANLVKQLLMRCNYTTYGIINIIVHVTLLRVWNKCTRIFAEYLTAQMSCITCMLRIKWTR